MNAFGKANSKFTLKMEKLIPFFQKNEIFNS